MDRRAERPEIAPKTSTNDTGNAELGVAGAPVRLVYGVVIVLASYNSRNRPWMKRPLVPPNSPASTLALRSIMRCDRLFYSHGLKQTPMLRASCIIAAMV